MKWVYVRFRGLKSHSRYEFYLVPIPPELTVSQFRALWGEESVVYVPTRMNPLSGQDRLYQHITEFDTITVESPWLSHQCSPKTARSASTRP